jgi:uncharacterized protein YraI
LVLSLAVAGLHAGDTALAKRDRVNVRGQPSLASEVITQLKKGEIVTVLEEIPAKSPKPNEPTKWTKIVMPTGTPVWVSASYINATNKTVVPRRVNLRAGPGEHFSVVGRIDKGTRVKEISTRGDWMEIEAPPNAYGFVASDLLQPQTSPPRTGAAPATPPTGQPPEAAPPMTVPIEQAKPAPRPETESTPPPAPGEAEQERADEIAAALTEAAPPPPPRIVRREGIISRTVSIQAPTYYQLNNLETGKVLDYLHAASANINLKKLIGKHVIVTGEEAIDSRWPRTPILEIETLETLP